jgi:hypothetical protein
MNSAAFAGALAALQRRVIAEITGSGGPSTSAASATAMNPHPASPASLPLI